MVFSPFPKIPFQMVQSPSTTHHVHLNVLLLLCRRNSSHLSYKSWIANTNCSPVTEIFRVIFFIQCQIAGGLKIVKQLLVALKYQNLNNEIQINNNVISEWATGNEVTKTLTMYQVFI